MIALLSIRRVNISHPLLVSRLTHHAAGCDTLIYVHAANDKESRLPAGLLDAGTRKRHIAVISKNGHAVGCRRRRYAAAKLWRDWVPEPIFEPQRPQTRKACGSWWIIWRLSEQE